MSWAVISAWATAKDLGVGRGGVIDDHLVPIEHAPGARRAGGPAVTSDLGPRDPGSRNGHGDVDATFVEEQALPARPRGHADDLLLRARHQPFGPRGRGGGQLAEGLDVTRALPNDTGLERSAKGVDLRALR